MISLMKCGVLSILIFVIFNGFLLQINGQTQDAQLCRLPNGTAGLCVPVTLCPNLQPILTSGPSWSNSDLQYLKDTICGHLRVCCTQPINEDSTGGTAPAGNGVNLPIPQQNNNPTNFNPNQQVINPPQDNNPFNFNPTRQGTNPSQSNNPVGFNPNRQVSNPAQNNNPVGFNPNRQVANPPQNNPFDFNPNQQVTRTPNRRTTRDLDSEYNPISSYSVDFGFRRNPEKATSNSRNTRNKTRRKPVKSYQEDDVEVNYPENSAEEETYFGHHHSPRKPTSHKHFAMRPVLDSSEERVYMKSKHFGHREHANTFENNDFVFPGEHSHHHHDIHVGRPKHHRIRDNQNDEHFHGGSKLDEDYSGSDYNKRHHTSDEHSGGHNYNTHHISDDKKPDSRRPFENDDIEVINPDRSNGNGRKNPGRRPSTSQEQDTDEDSPRRTQGSAERRKTGQVSGSSLLPRSNECGIAGLDDKIIGGNMTAIDQYPWMALIQYENRDTGKRQFSCGGSLISSRYILTAAHCLTGPVLTMIGRPVSVRLGEHDLTQKIDCITIAGDQRDCNDGFSDIEIESIHPHESYHLRRKTDDIGLIRLRSPAPTGSDFIQPICLPEVDSTDLNGFDGKYMIAGWGATTVDGSNRSNVKQHFQALLVDYEVCKRRYKSRYDLDPKSLGRQFCAAGKPGRDTCSGDSGGPVMRKDAATDRYTADGIISFGPRPCAEEGLPGVYTKVFAYIDWIESNMRP